jgi:Arc/MetJ-type ribon-helix-helix transcriptional regulator/plasmid stabilization system protein ParE
MAYIQVMQKLTVTLPDEIAEMVRRRVDSGGDASESDVIRDALKTIEVDPMRGREIEEWLKTVAVPDDAIAAGPSRGLSVEQVRASLAARDEGTRRLMLVIFTPEAQAHLDEIFDYIAESSPIAAQRFVSAIVDYCMTFELFPQRGTKRDDLLRSSYRIPTPRYDRCSASPPMADSAGRASFLKIQAARRQQVYPGADRQAWV